MIFGKIRNTVGHSFHVNSKGKISILLPPFVSTSLNGF